MLKIDLDRILVSNALVYLFTFMPGLFFLIAVSIANPGLSSCLTTKFQVAIPFDHFTILFVLLFLAFLIGATFITFVGLIPRLILRYAWSLWFYLKPFFCNRIVLPVLKRLLAVPAALPNSPPPKPKPRWLFDLYRKVLHEVSPPNPAAEPAFLWWEALAKQLLRAQYGMQEKDLPSASLQPLREVLTEPTSREQHGDVMFIALHATGWSALAAAYFAPALQATWFYVFAFFLIANGLHHDVAVVRLLSDPAIGDTLRLRAVLREFPKLKSQPTSHNEPKDDAGEN